MWPEDELFAKMADTGDLLGQSIGRMEAKASMAIINPLLGGEVPRKVCEVKEDFSRWEVREVSKVCRKLGSSS
jgi:hypothetical protein